MNPRLARLLTRLYPRPWRKRYGAEFEALLLASQPGSRAAANVLWSAMQAHIARGLAMDHDHHSTRLRSWCVRAPWAIFAFAPLFLLASAYCVACFILWSGWSLFLPGTPSPFVPVRGLAMLYFNAGRGLYYTAPMLVGWAFAVLAARLRIKALWPLVGLALITLTGATAQVQASRPLPSRAGHVSMSLAIEPLHFPGGLLHALTLFSLLALPSLLLRRHRTRSLST